MKPATVFVTLVLMLFLACSAALAKNGTIGIYAVIDQVTVEPNEGSPNLIRISGTFVVPVPMSSGMYQPPRRGFLYFRIPPRSEQRARKDWEDLKTYAGTGRVIGFAQYWVPNPSDRWGNPHQSLEVQVYADGEVASPSDYLPHDGGIFTIGGPDDPGFEKIAAQLQKFVR